MKLSRSLKLNPYLIVIVPFIDLMFVLLLLLFASSTFLVHPGISVNLPFSKFTLGQQKNPLIVSVSGAPFPLIYYEDQQVTLENLGRRLDTLHPSDRSIIIQADRTTPHGTVVEIMNFFLEKGYPVVLATSPKSS
ncbi:MAG: biopolymer transporter ExbD [Verrucomicrobia bacterium]|nr:biopolymer transporter ExbD [Verrucomicrobiota bacterium]